MEWLAEENGAARLQLRLFGPFRIFLAGCDVTPKSRKGRALLAYLACNDHCHISRESLAELLWNDRGEEQARASLRQTLSELRTGTPDFKSLLIIGRESVGLAASSYISEAAETEAAARQGTLAKLATLVGRCRGRILEDLDGISSDFDDWLRAERTRRLDLLVFTILIAVDGYMGTADKMDINTILSALERLDPGNEHVVRIGLRADHDAGDTASLHRRYRRLTNQLLREFDVRPSEETRALFDKLSTTSSVGVPTPKLPPVDAAASVVKPLTELPVILVSPLTTIDAPGEIDALADMCTDDIRVALAQVRDLRVLALDTLEAGRMVAVVSGALAGYILSGKVRRLDGQLRINIQLANITTGMIIWSEQLRVTPSALGDAVDHIVLRAAGAVMPAIERDLAAQLPKARVIGDDMVTLYARARQAVRAARNFPDCRAGATMLETVIAAEPNHLGARLLLARLYNTDFWQMIAGHDIASYRTRALDLVLEAAALEPHNPHVQLRLAWCHLRRRAWQLAQPGFEKALMQSPFDADAMNEVAHGFLCFGELDRAEATMQRAFQLNPFPPTDYHADFALIMMLKHDAVSAEAHFAISGESRPVYQALRVANSWYLAGDGAETSSLARQVLRGFEVIWQRQATATSNDIIGWLEESVVLRRDADREFLNHGLRSALALAA